MDTINHIRKAHKIELEVKNNTITERTLENLNKLRKELWKDKRKITVIAIEKEDVDMVKKLVEFVLGERRQEEEQQRTMKQNSGKEE